MGRRNHGRHEEEVRVHPELGCHSSRIVIMLHRSIAYFHDLWPCGDEMTNMTQVSRRRTIGSQESEASGFHNARRLGADKRHLRHASGVGLEAGFD